MKSFLAILQREITEQRRVFAAAGLLGLVPFLLPLMPGLSGRVSSEVRIATAMALCAALTAGLALLLGSSVLTRDLAERRIGFYFTRPIPGWAIWSGKLAGAALLIFTAGALILLPTLLVGDLEAAWSWSVANPNPAGLALLWAEVLLLLLLGAHALSTMLRSRSAWLALDLVCISLVTVLLLSLRGRLIEEGVYFWWKLARPALVAVLLLALAAATAMQIVRGRSDLHRSHRWLSLTLWGLVLGATLIVTAATARLLVVTPADFEELDEVLTEPASGWISLSGIAAGRPGLHPTFLLDTASSRRFVRIRPLRSGLSGMPPTLLETPQFSADGRWAAWLEGQHLSSPILVRLNLSRPETEPSRTPVSMLRAFALSPDGRRLALLHQDRLLLEETATGRLIDSFPQPMGRLRNASEVVRFLDSGRLRLYQIQAPRGINPNAERMVISEIDPGTRQIEQTGELSDMELLHSSSPSFSPDGERLLYSAWGVSHIFDARTGARLSALGTARQTPDDRTSFLADGRIAQIMTAKRRSELRIYDRNGKVELRRFSLPPARVLLLGGQPAPGILALGIHNGAPMMEPKGWTSQLLDLETGHTRTLAGLRPTGNPQLPPASSGSRLFVRDGNQLIQLDPSTGQEKRILGGNS